MELQKANLTPLCQALTTGKRYSNLIPKTIKEAQTGIQLSKARLDNEQALNAILTVIFKDVTDFLGGMEDKLIGMLISQIKTNYWHLKIEEIAYVLGSAINGKKKIYGKVTPIQVMNWFAEYDLERNLYYESENGKFKESNERYFEEKENEQRRLDYQDYKEEVRKNQIKISAKNDNHNR